MRALRLLLVEDNPADAELILRTLRAAEFAVDHRRVEDREAFLAALAEEPEIVVSDYELPQFCGLEALALLRQHSPETPFILISGTIGEEQAVTAMQQGAHDYLLKDRPARLGQAVTAALRNAELRRERLEAEAALRESEERFRQVVETIREVFWMTDAGRTRLLYLSPGVEHVWGRSQAEMGAGLHVWAATVHPDDRERVTREAATKQRLGEFDETYRIVRPDGSVRWVHDKAFAVKDARGEVVRLVGVAEDVTERKQLEQQFLRAQRMEAIGTLAGGLAHDLNNILAPMLMAAGLLKESATGLRDREMLEMVERSARRGAEIIRQLLTFSRGAEVGRTTVPLRHLLGEVRTIIRETFPRDLIFVDRVPAELWPVVADATQIHQVVVNLCVNARDAMPEGGSLTLAADNVEFDAASARLHPGARPGRYVVVTVADTGVGIAPEIRERIFDPFFTTKEIGRGTGLGLSTVLGIVGAHGGFVTVESEVGQGSVFAVYLPAAPGMESAAPTAEPVTPAAGRGELILLVDDEEPIRRTLREVLEKENYRVMTAENGKEALALFVRHREQIRLVLTDLMMPEMGGRALIGAVRTLAPGFRFLATSGSPGEHGRAEEGLSGVRFLPKPCSPADLRAAVRAELERVPVK